MIEKLQRITAEKGNDSKMKDSYLNQVIDNEKLDFLIKSRTWSENQEDFREN